MLHYSTASSIEESRRYMVIKGRGGLPGCSGKKEGRQQRSWTGHQQRRQSRSLPERRGGRNNKYNTNISMTVHDKTSNGATGALTRYEVVPVKGGNIREKIPGVSHFRTDEPEEESCVFTMLEMRGGRTGCVSGFVSSFWATFMYKVFPSELRFNLY